MKIQQKQACAHSHPVPLLHASTYPSPERWPLPQLDPAVAATSSIEGQSLVAPVVVNGEGRDGAATGTRGEGTEAATRCLTLATAAAIFVPCNIKVGDFATVTAGPSRTRRGHLSPRRPALYP